MLRLFGLGFALLCCTGLRLPKGRVLQKFQAFFMVLCLRKTVEIMIKVLFSTLLLSCTIFGINLDINNFKNEKIVEYQQKNNVDELVGNWKFKQTIPKADPNDRTMDGIVCKMEKVKGTKDRYIFNFWSGHRLQLRKVDSKKLVGENAYFNVAYSKEKKEIIIYQPNDDTKKAYVLTKVK